MPRISQIQTNFTAGEFSPRLGARVDIDRWKNSGKVLENVKIHTQGGVERRDGTRYIGGTKTNAKRSVLIPYVFNDTQAFMLEFGDGYIRFYDTNGQILSGGIPYEIPSPYPESVLFDLDYCQGADTMFIFNENFEVYRLRRYAATNWVLDVVPWVVKPVDEIGYYPNSTLTLASPGVGTGINATSSVAAFQVGDVGRLLIAQGGVAKITAVGSSTSVTISITNAFPGTSFPVNQWSLAGSPQSNVTPSAATPVGQSITLTANVATWHNTDVGGFVDINGGTVQITGFTSATVVNGIITTEMTAVAASPANAWTLKLPTWGGPFGYPRTGTLYQQRLWCAGSPGFPQSLWASVIGEYYDFTLSADDTDGLAITIASEELNPIQHITQLGALLVLTSGGEFTVKGGGDGSAITPTNINVMPQSNYGCSRVAPERVSNEMMFVQRANRKVRAMSADKINTDQYGSPDITVLNDTIGSDQIMQMAYQMEPISTLYAVRIDGLMACCTIDRDQDVVGWAHYTTDGVYESVATMPNEDGNEVWTITRRLVNNVSLRNVEKFDPAVMTDCCFTGNVPGGATVWTGLAPLEGKTVTVKGDGVHLLDNVVTGGQITTERAVINIEIGLKYVPTVQLQAPEIVMADGTSQISNMSVNSIHLRVLNTIGGYVNGQPMGSWKLQPGQLNNPPTPYSGDTPIETLGWEVGTWTCVITQPQPYPFELLGVITMLTVSK